MEKLYSPAAMFKKVKCQPREYACSPQCPNAIWHSKTQRIYFNWTERTNFCADIFKPDKTVIFLYTLYEYMSPNEAYRSIKDKIVIQTSGTSTDKFLSKQFNSMFYSKTNKLIPNEKYYVGAMYAKTLPSGMTVYGEP